MDAISRETMTPSEASTDRISDLPDNVIDKIVKPLSIVDVARMSIMSKKWRSYWLSISDLEFDLEFAETVPDDDKWFNTISNVLKHHQGTLMRFGVTIPSETAESCPRISKWIRSVSRKGVKHLAIKNQGDSSLITLPSHLFSCKGLESLYVTSCAIGPVPAGLKGFTSLLGLNLYDVEVEVGRRFKDFLARCPVLEKLELSSCEIDEPIIIDQPNLTDLTIEGEYQLIRLKGTSSLVSLSLGLDDYVVEIIDEWPVELIKFVSSSCKLENLCLCGDSCKILADNGISSILPLTFMHLKRLSLHISEEHQDGFFCGIDMLHSCPNIESLEITLSAHPRSLNNEKLNAVRHDGSEPYTLKPETEYTTLNHLQDIVIMHVGLGNMELKLVECLLARSPSLEKFTFTCKNNMEPAARSEVRRNIHKFKRASSKAKVVCVKLQ